MKLFKLFKKILVIWFTKNPYKVQFFNTLYQPEAGSPLDVAERKTGILATEVGDIIIYNQQPVSLNDPVKLRYIGKHPRYHSTGIFKEPDRHVFSLENGCIISQLGLVYDARMRSFIDESGKEWDKNIAETPFANAINLPPRKFLAGITLSFITTSAEAGFYHFLIESVTKAAVYRHLLTNADQLLFNGPQTEWKLKWLQKAGIDTSKIIWTDGYLHYQCEQLIFTNRLIADQQISNWCLQSLKQLFNVAQPALQPQRAQNVVMLTRRGLNVREIKWEDDLLSAFKNIRCADLRHLSADETIELMQTATHVIGPHGAGLSNIYLCQPGTKVLEIYPHNINYQPYYLRIATLGYLNYNVMYLDFDNASHPTLGLEAFKKAVYQFLDN